jgi:cytochrome c553
MFKMRFSTISVAVAILAFVAMPARAADEIEASLEVCSSCHGQNGQPINATIPVIWGQQASYLMKQLHDYKSKDRNSAVMAAFVESIKQPDLRKVANYFAAKPWPSRPAANASAAPPNGMATCRICHQENFQGGAPAPRLAGQSYEYLLAAMNGFANDERENSADMMTLMKALTASQREAMAKYLSAL